MGAELEFDKKCRVSLSPNTVLPRIPPSPNVEKRSSNGRPRRRDELLIIEDHDFTEIRFSRFRSTSCKNEPSKPLGLESGVDLRRGSVYQTSREVRSIKKMGTEDVRSKIEISRSSDKYLSIRNIDSPCGSSHGSPLNKFNINPDGEPCSSDGSGRNKSIMSSVAKLSREVEPVENSNCRFEHVAGPELPGIESLEKYRCSSLYKSVSAKVEMQCSPHPSSAKSPRASPKSRLNPLRKFMDPFMKSKSLKSPLGYGMDCGEVRRRETGANTGSGITLGCLAPDISDKGLGMDANTHFVEKDCFHPTRSNSPTQLHGCLKVKKINGASVLEFSLKSPEDVFVAKTWKLENVDSWVYTFHSTFNRKQSNASARGSKVSDNIDTTFVGQMQVSSYLHSEHRDDNIGDSLTTEFVLYDIAHANRGVPAQEIPISSPDTSRLSKGSLGSLVEERRNSDNQAENEKLTSKLKCASDLSICDSTSYPWAPEYLHPNLEVAAIVIQVPFEKTESLKHGKNDKGRHVKAKRRTHVPATSSFPKINVVVSTGNHSLPDTEGHGPSPLLSRWRSGGGCECGGWDMTCPLIVFNNGADNKNGSHLLPLVEKKFPTELFIQGVKDNTPAFSMTAVDEGHYSVYFQARLSSLQAFSICIALLHSSETPAPSSNNMNTSKFQCNTLKMFIDDEVKFLIESVTEDNKKKKMTPPSTKDKKSKVSPSAKESATFTFYPPFSPISRA